ncbi:MAG: PKD domain-containing protein, partial [Bacteroidia bacterium]
SFGSYTAQLIVLSDSGCTDTTTNVAVLNAIPNVSFSASNVCLGDDLSPKNNSTISSGTITNWSWDFDDTNTSNAKSPTNTYASKGTYNIKLVATSNNGCKDSTTNQVVVDNVIIAGFTTNDVCLGDTAFFTNTTNTSCGTITGYQWDFGDGAAATTANPFRVYTKAGTFDVRLIVVQQGGNRDTAIVKVTVSPKPKVNFFASNECANEQVQFQNLSTISLGSISSFEWNFKDGNKATAQNPKHNYNAHGQYDVSLIAISNKGCIDSSSKSIDIYEVPKVDFIANDVCFGASVDFKNGSSISTGSMNYTWTFGDGFSSTQSNPTYTYKKADNYTVKLTATSNNFCQESLSKALKVNEVPNIAYTVNDTCALDELNINNTTAIGSGTLSYIWTFDNSNSSVAKNPTYAIANSGTFDIKLKVLSNLGCSDSLTQQVEIFEKPNAQFTYSGSCPDKPVSFTNTSTPSSSITSQQWLFNGSNASTTPNPSYTFGTTGPHQVLLTVTNSNNCIDTSEQQIIFESVPVASFSFNNACERDTTYFTNNSEIKSGTATYQWSFGDGNESTINNGKNVYSTLGLYDVKLIATSDKGCKDSITQTVNPINKPEIDFNIQGACLGDSSIFMNLSTQNTGTYYLWNFGDNSAIDSAYNTSHLYANTGTYQVKVTGFASTGCSDTLSKKITVAEGPKNLDFTYNNACARSKVQFTNQTKNSNLTFRWAFFDGSFSTQRDPQKYYAKAGEYPIGFEAREGDCADSTYKLITIYPYADSSFTFIGLGNREISFEPIDSNINSFEWKFGDGNSSTDYNPSHTYSSDGTYKVVLEVTTPNGCKTVSEREVVIKGNSISWNSQNEIDFSVYPNPFKEHLIGEFEILNDGHVQIQIFNEVGQLVKTPVDENLLKGKYQYSLLETSSELKTGVYFVKMISNDSVAIKTVILQR